MKSHKFVECFFYGGFPAIDVNGSDPENRGLSDVWRIALFLGIF